MPACASLNRGFRGLVYTAAAAGAALSPDACAARCTFELGGLGQSIAVRVGSGVGNSPLFLDESSDHGLGQRYEDILMQSSGTGNLPGGIDPKTRPPGGTIAS